jgi:hypothetical protein
VRPGIDNGDGLHDEGIGEKYQIPQYGRRDGDEREEKGKTVDYKELLRMEPDSGVTIGVASAVGATPTSGQRHPEFFDANPELRGDVFLTVRSDCSWAVSVVRVLDDEDPE